MRLSRQRLVGVAAALSAVAIAAPVSTASAVTAAPGFIPGPLVTAGWGGYIALPFATPVFGQSAAVIGPTIITTAPSTFINTNNQVSAGGNWSGGQAAPW